LERGLHRVPKQFRNMGKIKKDKDNKNKNNFG
jgi:hypothetical protein